MPCNPPFASSPWDAGLLFLPLPLPLLCPGIRAASVPIPGCQGAAGGCQGTVGVLLGAAGVLLRAAGVPHACSSTSSPRQLEQFKADNQDIGFGSGTRALEQALERTRANIKWVKENQETVLAWFQGETASI